MGDHARSLGAVVFVASASFHSFFLPFSLSVPLPFFLALKHHAGIEVDTRGGISPRHAGRHLAESTLTADARARASSFLVFLDTPPGGGLSSSEQKQVCSPDWALFSLLRVPGLWWVPYSDASSSSGVKSRWLSGLWWVVGRGSQRGPDSDRSGGEPSRDAPPDKTSGRADG